MLSEQQVNRAIELYADMIKKICMLHLKNHADTEDIFQTVFLKYMTASPVFENQEHEKAWLIRVTINACHDLIRSFFRSKTVSLGCCLGTAFRAVHSRSGCSGSGSLAACTIQGCRLSLLL